MTYNLALNRDCAKIARVFPGIIDAEAPDAGGEARSPSSTLAVMLNFLRFSAIALPLFLMALSIPAEEVNSALERHENSIRNLHRGNDPFPEMKGARQ